MPAVRLPDGTPRLVKRTAPWEDTFRVRCGQCVGCMLDKAEQWGVRMVHESMTTRPSCFLTLTYNDESVPGDFNLRPDDFTLFMKRLRKKLGDGISYFMCGEYGGRTYRPHYHAALFGEDFSSDRSYYGQSKSGFPLYRSESLDLLWGLGHVDIGDMSFHSAAYVARYTTKALPSNLVAYQNRIESNPHNMRARWQKWVDQVVRDQERSVGRVAEYARMSRRPALGKRFFERYIKEIYPRDVVVIDAQERRVPQFYDRLLERLDPEMFERVKEARIEKAPEEIPWEQLQKRGYARQQITDAMRREIGH